VRLDDPLRDVEPEAAAAAIAGLLLPVALDKLWRACPAATPGTAIETFPDEGRAEGARPGTFDRSPDRR